ncbi:hypothetical protein [Candidatus Soleaferrea massiliensis]|uniref:hypothetical protein n=1 Tax=Candidatus Soleaferrea massiliensis TaxID=1470354 RepID=UPI0005914978|nr:hypothetical protein [Candidatus Soleaferrea massiliensis]
MKKYVMFLMTMVLLVSLTACADPSSGTSGNSQAGRSPNANQQTDAAYNLDDLIAAVEKAGGISGKPETLDVKDIGAERGIAYGNVVFLQYDPSSSNAYFDAYEANQVTVKGKTVQIGAINGPYFMVFLDGNVDQNAVNAFYSIGFGS